MKKRQCAMNPILAEFSLCGDAFDAYDSGDAEEQYEIVAFGGTVTCPQCCIVIAEVKAMKYKLRPRKNNEDY